MRGGLGLSVAVALCVGCATARVKNVQQAEVRTLPRPARVVVFDFATGGADVRVGSSPSRTARRAVGLSVAEPDLLGEAVADTLANTLVEQIKALGLPAERASGAEPPRVNDLVVMGQFVRIDEGSKTKRFVIGFGVGATELRTQVEVFQVTAAGWQPIKHFDTVATGSRLPGAGWFVAGGAIAGSVATSAVVSSGVGVLRELRASIDADAGRTAEEITTKLSELSRAQRW
jgi:hypothetical protein